MQKSPLVQTLAALNLRERQELGRWVQSPAFNRRPEVVELYDWLCAQSGGSAPEPELSNKRALRRHLSVDEPGLRHTMSYLFRIVKQYLAWREWTADSQSEGRYLCRALRKKGLSVVFDKEFKTLENAPQDAPQNAAFYLERYQIAIEHWEAQHRKGPMEGNQLRASDAAFSNFVAITALRHGCAALDQPGLIASQEISWLAETVNAVEAGRFAVVPAVQVYYHCYKLMHEGSVFNFEALKKLLAGQPELLPSQELRDVYLIAINFCIKKLNTGARNFIREALDLYRLGLERQVIQDSGVLSKATYQNILLLALASEEWDWARNFLETYRNALPSAERHNTYHFNLALYFFRKKDYAAAQEILRDVDFRDVHHNLDARRMLVRIYFDTGAFDALDALLHSFRIYLQRHRNIGYHRELNANFVRIVQQLLKLPPGAEQAREDLRQRITNEPYLAEREWLLEQIELAHHTSFVQSVNFSPKTK
ncbi:MAG: hypothetical protein H6574_09440 [Lewinellaceae bacterium]|nr:hypothetical protein [Saprospiraceae bacterium]MCB9331292.1 hypothetical protein [Lewinellaceae bacterium]